MEESDESIPTEMPPNFLEAKKKKMKHVEGVGEPITATFLVDTKTNPANWYTLLHLPPSPKYPYLEVNMHVLNRWVFEKYDGVRGFWNPVVKAMFSRQGKKLFLPDEIIQAMPSDSFLDGELW